MDFEVFSAKFGRCTSDVLGTFSNTAGLCVNLCACISLELEKDGVPPFCRAWVTVMQRGEGFSVHQSFSTKAEPPHRLGWSCMDRVPGRLYRRAVLAQNSPHFLRHK